jgi:hypothetical protein
MKTAIEAKCPVCLMPLVMQPGHRVNRLVGFSVECPNLACKMEDWGWGRTMEEAVKVFQAMIIK